MRLIYLFLPEQLLNNVHWDQDSEYFIGHSNDEILLKSSYWQGPSTRILAYNGKTNIKRNATYSYSNNRYRSKRSNPS